MPLNKKSGLVPWDYKSGDNNYQKEPWILKKGTEKISFTRCKMDNSSFTIQKNQERSLVIHSFQARDTYRKLIENGYKLGRK